jgi:predicted dehydrogenase
MLDREELDAVSVCTPPPAHREIAEAAAARGLHILCEKPLAMSVADGESMVAIARRSGVVLMTAFCQRFMGHVIETRDLIRAGKLGEVHQFRFRRGENTSYEQSWIGDPDRGGGLFWESGAHSVDMFRFLVGEIAAVFARGATRAQGMKGADTIAMLLEGMGGEIGIIEQSWSSPDSENRIEIHGELGAIVIDHNSGRTRISDRNGTRWLETDEKRIDRFRREVAHFIDCVEGKAVSVVSGEDGVEAMRAIEAAVRSARSGTREPLRR